MLLLGLIALLRLPFKRELKVGLVSVILLMGLAGFFWRYSSFFQKGATSVGARFDYWRAAAQTAREHPLFGTGPGTFAIAYQKIKRPESEMARLTHNDYLEQASDSGLVALLTYLVFIVGALGGSYPKARLAAPGETGTWLTFAVWLGVLGNTLYQIAFTLALLWSTATNTALILATMPAVVTVLAGVRRIERVTPRMWAGTALATLGVALVISTGGIEFSASTLKGDACAVAAVIFWSVYTLGLRRIPATVPPLTTTALTTLTGTPGLVLAGLVPIVGVDWLHVPAPAWGALADSSFLSLVVAYFIWNASVQRVGGTRTAIYMCLTPLVAALTAWATLGERLVPLQGVGAALILRFKVGFDPDQALTRVRTRLDEAAAALPPGARVTSS